MPGTAYNTLSVSIHRVAEAYQVELTHSDPDSQAQVAPVRGAAARGAGGDEPIDTNDTAKGRAKDRRCEFRPP